jgi:hypothetical protein
MAHLPFAVLLERELDRLADGYPRAVLSVVISWKSNEPF